MAKPAISEPTFERDEWPPERLESVLICPLCQSRRRHEMYRGLNDPMVGGDATWTLWTCEDCGGAYLDPRPTKAAIGSAYHRDYYTHRAGRAPVSSSFSTRIRTSARNGLLNASLQYQLTPASELGGQLLRIRRRRAEISMSSVRHLAFRNGGKLLDVGAGAGEFVSLMRAAGWDAEGLDPDPDAVQAAREAGIPVVCGDIERFAIDENAESYDAITLNHVIEHLHDPTRALAACRRLLKPDGVIWIATPNLDSEGRLRFGRNWVHLDPPRHLVLFTPTALGAAMARAGFTGARRVRTGSMARASFLASAALAADRGADGVRSSPVATPSPSAARIGARLHPRRTEEVAMIGRAGGPR